MKNHNQYKLWALMAVLMVIISLGSCKKFIEVDAPITSVNAKNVYTENSNAIAVLTGLYQRMSSTDLSLNISKYLDLSSDNLSLFDDNNISSKMYYQNNLSPDYTQGTMQYWTDLYSYLYVVNSAIEGISESSSLNPDVKKHLLGEAYFMRGFFYFYLTNLYGDVPLILTTDYKVNSLIAKSATANIYDQIVNDLKQAKSLLNSDYVDVTVLNQSSKRLRPNKLAASALLARVYLYNKKYDLAEAESTFVISQTNLYAIESLDNAFLQNSKEIIWALQSTSSIKNTSEGNFYIFDSEGPNSIRNVFLSKDLLETFDEGDQRKTHWIQFFNKGAEEFPYPYKYKVKDGDGNNPNEYTIVLRLAEQYLIRAEARIQQNNISNGISDLNVLRHRATDLQAQPQDRLKELNIELSKDQALVAVSKERRIELFTEWGNRWFDLKRTDQIDPVMNTITTLKGGIWKSYKSLFPIPQSETNSNPLLTQNSGY